MNFVVTTSPKKESPWLCGPVPNRPEDDVAGLNFFEIFAFIKIFDILRDHKISRFK